LNMNNFRKEIIVGQIEHRNFLPYYTNSPWSKDEDFFIFFSENEAGREPSLNCYFPDDDRIEQITDLKFLEEADVASQEGRMLCSVYQSAAKALFVPVGNTIIKVDIDTGEYSEWYRAPMECRIGGPLCISEDNNFLCGGFYISDKPHTSEPDESTIFILDLNSQKLVISKKIAFWGNHFQFLPDNETVLLAHEGAAETVPDRLNTFNIRTGEICNIYCQQHNMNGELVEFVGHEKVAGNKVVAVRYPISSIEFGIIQVDPATGVCELVDQDDYWHCSANATGDRLIMDTMWWGNSSRNVEFESDIILLDMSSGQKQILKTNRTSNLSQIYHPHPQLNRNGDKVLFISRDNIPDDSSASQIIFQKLQIS
jgi:hypothetical protein